MRLRNNILASLMVAAVSMGVLTGCGSNNVAGGQSGTNGSGDGKAPVTLTIAARGGSHVDVIEAVKGKFETEHNVKIEVLGLEAADLKQKVALDAMNKDGAYDLVMIDDPVMPEFIDGEVLLNLTKAGYQEDSDFVAASLALGKGPYGAGDTYALPYTGNVQLLFYNQELLDSMETSIPTSWEEVLEVAQKVKESGKIGYVIRGQQGNPIVSDYLPLLWAYGGTVFDDNWNVTIDSQEAKDALQIYMDLLAVGGNYEKNDIVAAVSDGNGAMALGWPSWFISGEETSAAYAAVPSKVSASSQSNQTGMIGNWMMGVTANSKNQEVAIELLEYLTSAEVQKTAVNHGGVPTRTSVFTDSEIVAKYPYFTTIYEGTMNSVVRPRTAQWSSVEETLGIELSNAISGVKTIEQALNEAKIAIEALHVN